MGGDGPRPRYTFGDTPLAADRLELVARVFDGASRSFLAAAIAKPPGIALDLGCGPGISTRLIAEVTGAVRTIGIDTSTAFLERAARGTPEKLEFERHDATRIPLPGAPADLIFCRLLLAHVADVEGTLIAWMGQLVPGGRLLVDEVEWIETSHPVLAAYEAMVVGLVESRGAPMYAGPIVDRMHAGPGWLQASGCVRTVRVTTADAARMYLMNLTTWRDDAHIRDRYDASEVDRLARDLSDLSTSSASGEITWGLRQVVFERVP
jgi:SAM-dependent methyltransferase